MMLALKRTLPEVDEVITQLLGGGKGVPPGSGITRHHPLEAAVAGLTKGRLGMHQFGNPQEVLKETVERTAEGIPNLGVAPA